MTMRFLSTRPFARIATALARFWYTLTSAWGSFRWRHRIARKHKVQVNPKVRKFHDLMDDLAHEKNAYRRRQLMIELRHAWNEVRDAKAMSAYPRSGPAKMVQIDNMMTLLNARYYASP